MIYNLIPDPVNVPQADTQLSAYIERNPGQPVRGVLPDVYLSAVFWTPLSEKIAAIPGTRLYFRHAIESSSPTPDSCEIGFEMEWANGSGTLGVPVPDTRTSGIECYGKRVYRTGSILVPSGVAFCRMYVIRVEASGGDNFFYVDTPYMGRTPASIASLLSDTLLSQYANSPILTGIAADLAGAIDQSGNLEQFYNLVWNVETAQGWGLDVWGRIVGVRRVLRVPVPGTYLGFAQDADAVPFGFGIWYGLGSSSDNYTLTDDAYRRLILAKAALNITDASIPSINRILMALFPGYGNVYVRDDGGMEMTYVFSAPLTAVDFAIVTQSGVLPKPIGVTAGGESP